MKSGRVVDYPTMSGPAIYRIRVRGRLAVGLSERLEGMHIENLARSDGNTESVLEGRLLDQAALAEIGLKLRDDHELKYDPAQAKKGERLIDSLVTTLQRMADLAASQQEPAKWKWDLENLKKLIEFYRKFVFTKPPYMAVG